MGLCVFFVAAWATVDMVRCPCFHDFERRFQHGRRPLGPGRRYRVGGSVDVLVKIYQQLYIFLSIFDLDLES